MGSKGASPESVASESGSEERLPPSSDSIKKDGFSTSNIGERFEYFGWVYHLGINSIGRENCNLRFLFVRGKYLEMYKRDPHENPGIKPIRRGVIGNKLMVEELGRRKLKHGDVYVLRFYNRLDEKKKGEIACATAHDSRKWMEAFDHAKQQVEYELSRGVRVRNKLNMEDEINLDLPRVWGSACGLNQLIRIGQGADIRLDADGGDVVEAHEWKCARRTDEELVEEWDGDMQFWGW